ncbi:OprO/OprP family phosphate-selective porin [Hydrogenimonas sp.]
MQSVRFLLLALLLPLTLWGRPWTYTDAISEDYKPSDYDWNALSTRWVNMRAIALLGLDAAHFYQSDANRAMVGDMSRYDRLDVRGIRLGVGGTFNFSRPWSYLVSVSINSLNQDYDPDNDDPVTLLDAMVSIPVWGHHGYLRIGKMKEPDSMTRLMGLVFEQVMERPMHVDAFTPTRNIGISLSDTLWDERATWRAGIFNDWLDRNRPNISENSTQLIGRATVVAYEKLIDQKLLHLGVSLRYDNARSGFVRYEVGPEFSYCDPWLDTGEIPADSALLSGAEVTWLQGPLWIDGEYSHQRVERAEGGSLAFDGWHLSANWFLTGEHRGYDYIRGIVKRVRPDHPVNKGGWGALELSTRYSWLDLDDGPVRGGRMGIWSFGAIWHPIYEMQLHLQYSHAELDGPVPARGIPPGSSRADIVQFRFVVLID